MFKVYCTLALVMLIICRSNFCFAQNDKLTVLKARLKNNSANIAKVDDLNDAANILLKSNLDSAELFINEAITLSQRLKYKQGEASALINLSLLQSNYNQDLSQGTVVKAYGIYKSIGDASGQITSLNMLGAKYQNIGDYPNALENFYNALLLAEKEGLVAEKRQTSMNISYVFVLLGDIEKAKSYQESFFQDAIPGESVFGKIANYQIIAETRTKEEKYTEAIDFYKKAQTLAKEYGLELLFNTDQINIANCLGYLGKTAEAEQIALKALSNLVAMEQNTEMLYGYLVLGRINLLNKNYDKSEYYAKLAFEGSKAANVKEFVKDAAEILYKVYEVKKDINHYNIYREEYESLKDSLSGEQASQLIIANQKNFELENQKNQLVLLKKESELNQASIKNQRNLLYGSILATLALLTFLFVMYRNNQNQKKLNSELSKQKREIESQKQKLEHAIKDLGEAQNQLVQREKLASLGELTAGIAHEIQNPLNFVNNFSEVSVDLIAELQAELIKPIEKRDASFESEILGDLSQNLEKITNHGKRAASIVKGMLMHSRKSEGERSITDLNALVDEYLKLSYHGMRAKDKAFNAEMETKYYEALPQIMVVAQDIGRVFLNLINNAFQCPMADGKLRKVTIKTQLTKNYTNGTQWVVVEIIDNGTGIPDELKEKIFQPFFTTKAAGQGTGLGLSISYDIVVKGHNGRLSYQSKKGQGTTFTVELPVV